MEAVVDHARVRVAVRSRRDAFALPGLAAALALGVWLQGGFYPSQAVLVVAVLTVTGILTGGRVRMARAVVSAVRLLGGTLMVAITVSDSATDGLGAFMALLVAVVVLCIATRAVHADGQLAVLEAVAAVGAVTAALGIAGVVFHVPRLAVDGSPWRLASAITYQNAAGALLAMALPVAAVLASRAPTMARRAVMVLVASGLVLTWSRGAALGAVVAVVLLMAARAVRPGPLLRPAAGAAVCVAAVTPAAVGAAGGPVVALAGLALGLWLGMSTRGSARAMPSVLILAGAAVAVGVLAASTSLGGRFTASSMGRAQVWSSTVSRLDGSMLFGSGPGSYGLVTIEGEGASVVRFAHNEYLQAVAETGLVGGIGIAGAVLLIGAALWRARPRRGASREVWAPCVAGCSAFAVQSGTDFLWRFPVLIAIAFTLIAVATCPGPPTGEAVSEAEAR